MGLIASQSLQPDFIKMRWLEPYVTAGLNRKTFMSIPRGVYSGFAVIPTVSGTGTEITVTYGSGDPYGSVTGFTDGSFDPSVSGWSVAVHASLQGYCTTVAILATQSGANDFVFSLSGYVGSTVFVALDVQYAVGVNSTAQVKVLQASDLDSDPTLINLARVDVPMSGPILPQNIIYDDSVYPRVLPFANALKYGYMSKFQAELLDELSQVSGAPAFVSEYVVPVDGPQVVPLPPGAIYTVNGNDLWVFKNGTNKSAGGPVQDYQEVDRGDGYGVEINYIDTTLKAGDVIKFRVQRYASVLASKLQVFDEYALISQDTIFMNFTGAGVNVYPDGLNRVRVTIPGGGGESVTRTKMNNQVYTIPMFRAVSLLPDNSIRFFDTSVSSESFYGITTATIPPGVSGNVQSGGIVLNAGVGVGDYLGQDVYISQNNDGTLVTSDFVSALSGQVIRVGKLDADNNISVPQDILFDIGRLA